MKVLHIYKDYYPVLGGIGNHVRLLCNELAEDKNFQVQVLVTNERFKTVIERNSNFEVIKASRILKFASTPISLSLFKWIARLKADIVHLHFPFPPGEIACLLLGHYKKMVITYHSDIVRQKLLGTLYSPILSKVLRKADTIIVQSPAYAKNSRHLSKHFDKCKIIPSFIDTQCFQGRNERKIEEIKSKYGSSLALFVGKFRYYKGVNHLIEAAGKTNCSFLLIGNGYLEKDLKSLVYAKGLSHKVHFMNNVDEEELPSYYQASDIFVLPSIHRSESFGLVLLEAMACGIPIISTELGTGTSWVNLHNQTGLVIPPRDSEALANAMNHLLLDKDKRLRFGKAGIERVRNVFSKDIVVEQIKKLYYQLISESQAP